jgi:hypothetical protein
VVLHGKQPVVHVRGRIGSTVPSMETVEVHGLRIAGVLHAVRERCPALPGGAVDAGDHWDIHRPHALLDQVEIASRCTRSSRVVEEVRDVRVRGRVLNLLLEQGVQHHCSHTGLDQLDDPVCRPDSGDADATSGLRSDSPR